MNLRRTCSPIRIRAAAAGLAFAAAVAAPAKGPFLGPNQFPQFRTLSGMSGAGFGLDFEGFGSLNGPTAFSTPIAYVLGHNQFRLTAGETLFDKHKINHTTLAGKASLQYGATFGRFNIDAGVLVKSGRFDTAINAQVQYIPSSERSTSFSVGVQDIRGKAGSAGEDVPGDSESSRSIFGVVTQPFTLANRTVFFSGGIGTRRFQKGFASLSGQLTGPVRLWAEYDGFGFNEGILLAAGGAKLGDSYAKRKGEEADLMIGFARGRYLTAALTIGF